MRYDEGISNGDFSETVQDYYRRQYFEAVDLAVASIEERLNHPGYAMYRNLEEVLV
jgi:hypothetical protein